jgi:hypothetical protein
LLGPKAQVRFDEQLVTPQNGVTSQKGTISLGVTVTELLNGIQLGSGDALPGPPDKVLAVSPSFLRIETARLSIPDSYVAYKSLVVNGQGAKVSLAVDQCRDAAIFDPVHEVVVQEQIWRWNGKLCMPEDFQGDGGEALVLPTPGDSELVTDDYFAWDGIAFHNREDIEHLAVMSKLPLAKAVPMGGAGLGDVLYTDDKSSDARALYFRFSALMRSRYFGTWPSAVQAGLRPAGATAIDTLWKRYALPHRLTTQLKKPSVVMIIPLLASGNSRPQSGDSAGVLAIIREAAFEQGGLAEKLECELVRSPSFVKDAASGLVMPDKTGYFQAGYDPILSAVALQSFPTVDAQGNAVNPPKSPLATSGPVGLTFDQTSRDPLIVNSLYIIDINRADLKPLVDPNSMASPPTNVPASHLFCQLRFRRTLRWGYDADGKTSNGKTSHPLASEWTEAQWVKFLADSDLLRPDDGTGNWSVLRDSTQLHVRNWTPPQPWSPFTPISSLSNRYTYLLCVTRDDLDAVGRPATRFHSLYQIKTDKQLSLLAFAADEQDLLKASALHLRGRIIEVLCATDDLDLPEVVWGSPQARQDANWFQRFMPPPHAGVTREAGPIAEDATFQAQSLSAAYPIEFA